MLYPVGTAPVLGLRRKPHNELLWPWKEVRTALAKQAPQPSERTPPWANLPLRKLSGHFSLYVNDMPSPLHHVELALYADDTAIIATSRKPTLLANYLESYLKDLQRWLSEWRIAVIVSKSTTIIFVRAGRRFIQLRPVTLFSEPIEWVDTTCYVGVTLDT
jgi:hypothetical protein